MLDPQTYRANELLAKSLIPSWRISQIHNVDHFERAGFPVRITCVREIGQIVDTMQENRFQRYMTELGGLSKDEYDLILDACECAVRFQLIYLPHRQPVLPISTLLSAFALRRKMLGANPNFRSVLEIGPGCGYLSFFLRYHTQLANYSQIEACESFYILQNLVNVYCFGHRLDERALASADVSAIDYYVSPRADMEFSPSVRLGAAPPLCVHYPWWRIGEIISQDVQFDIVTSNANLLEFNAPALDDYLSLMHHCLKPEGIFLVQCTGFPASGTVEQLLEKLHQKGFAPLMFTKEQISTSYPGDGQLTSLVGHITGRGKNVVEFTTNNALFVKAGHPLFERYYDRRNYHFGFVAPESIVKATFFDRPAERRSYTVRDFLETIESRFGAADEHRKGYESYAIS